jgi:nitrite reductase/ring-hydroxylating ferredoxin subunit
MPRLICASTDLMDGGDGFRFEVIQNNIRCTAFVLRWHGRPYAYLNACAHLGLELDWNPGKFFDDEGGYLLCAVHGARFKPDSGYCVDGPCMGRTLQCLNVFERDGNIFLEVEQ